MKRNTVHILAATLALGAALALQSRAEIYAPAPTPGGLQVSPILGTPTPVGTNKALVPYTGLQAPYMVQVSSDLVNWTPAGFTTLKCPNHAGTVLATNVPADPKFRLMMLGSTNWVGKWNTASLSVSNAFLGSNKCNGCHGDKVAQWSKTGHAKALSSLNNIGMGTNPNCVVCHTVGFNQPGGFVDTATTPHLANVQCESCHGASASHVNISGRQYHPVNSLAAEICGGCHNGDHHPTYDEWMGSPHKHQDSHIVEYFEVGSSTATPQNQMMSCGACHSAAVRLAMLNDYEARKRGSTNFMVVPSSHDATYATASCVVCHDPHATNGWSAQLRNPLSSTNFYTFATSTTPVKTTNVNHFGVVTITTNYLSNAFASQYNPNIQICGQCHNSRGATWQSSSRPPHHSPQYNMLIGIVQQGYLNTNSLGIATNRTSRHGGITKSSSTGIYNTNQCVTCHVVQYAPGQTNGFLPIVDAGVTNGWTPILTTNFSTGHTFALDVNGCTACHTSITNNRPEALLALVHHEQDIYKSRMSKVITMLTYWSTNIAPTIDPAFASHAEYAWEYTTAGQISNPTGTNTFPGVTNIIAGPSSTLQAKVPDVVKQARFNLYMVEHDGSYGLHNRSYSTLLLQDATNKLYNIGVPLPQ